MAMASEDWGSLRDQAHALKGSAANRFYQRHGFVCTGVGLWDVDYLRPPLTPALRVVGALWAAMQARDWTAAHALLRDDLEYRDKAQRFSDLGKDIAEVVARWTGIPAAPKAS